MQNYDYVLVFADPSHHRSYRDALPDLDLRLTAAAEEFERRCKMPVDRRHERQPLRCRGRCGPQASAARDQPVVAADRRRRSPQSRRPVRAKAIGASHVVATSLEAEALVRTLSRHAADAALRARTQGLYRPDHRAPGGRHPGHAVLEPADRAADRSRRGARAAPASSRRSVRRHSAWLASVRRRRAGTFQHCLLVTGLAIAFAAPAACAPPTSSRSPPAACCTISARPENPTGRPRQALRSQPGRVRGDEVPHRLRRQLPARPYDRLAGHPQPRPAPPRISRRQRLSPTASRAMPSRN